MANPAELQIFIKLPTDAANAWVQVNMFNNSGWNMNHSQSEYNESLSTAADTRFVKQARLTQGWTIGFSVKYADPTRADIAKINEANGGDGILQVQYCPEGKTRSGVKFYQGTAHITSANITGGVSADQELAVELTGTGPYTVTTV